MTLGLSDFVRMTETLGPVFPCGHKKTPENTYVNKRQKRCLECKRANAQAYALENYRRKYG